jgi:Domain of unknown function (DUF4333)
MPRAIIVSLLLTALVGCAEVGTEPSAISQPGTLEMLDTDGLEHQLKAQIGHHADVAVRKVDCPDDVPIEAGTTFKCIAEDRSESTYTIAVTLRDDEGNLDWVVEGP